MLFSDVLNKYRNLAYSEADKGHRLERLMLAFLKTDPQYAPFFHQIWLWQDFPYREQLGLVDTGIDLVGFTQNGEYWAIQCKCYQETSYIDKPAVDTFLATSSRSFFDENHQKQSFSQRLWISTTNLWTQHAEEALKNQNPPVTRINLSDLAQAPVDWEKLEKGIHGENARSQKKPIFPHVLEIRDKVLNYFQQHDRGRLIMACGTGKTITSLKIAEKLTNHQGFILFLVPSIALIGQTLREWTSQADETIYPICICSDPEISKKKTLHDDGSISVIDLAAPASTNPEYILKQLQEYSKKSYGMKVVFSTYQSIDVIAKAQKTLLLNGFPEFDLIICDEAHRTCGFAEPDYEDSAFVKVHDNDFIRAKKRLYMTATPKLYSTEAKSKAAQHDITLWSMDDEKWFGKEIHRLGFGEAVEKGLLSDYKVIILTVKDDNVPPDLYDSLSQTLKSAEKDKKELKTDDISKLVGTINALSKKFVGNDAILDAGDEKPMKRAIAFCGNIQNSKNIAQAYRFISSKYSQVLPLNSQTPEEPKNLIKVDAKHMDGSMSAPVRDQMLQWLKEDTKSECRIITNVKVLSEGVDVPSMDAVIFISPKNSTIDVVQSVGRVMRKAPGKNYGYIIIPVVVPPDVEPEKVLDDNERFKVVWTVLNALRAHDDRFNAIVNKIELNKKKPTQILVGMPEYSFNHENAASLNLAIREPTHALAKNIQLQLQFAELQNFLYAKLVQKVGDRRYWEQWAKDIAIIAERQSERIRYLISNFPEKKLIFDAFLSDLHENINPTINSEQAIEMLSQHLITKPIFETLFEGYSFAQHNPVSVAMQKVMNALEPHDNLAQQDENLQKFYHSIQKRAEGIDNAEGKQRIIIELYDKFFRIAFPKMAERLGIVYTPVEVVDFILYSVNDILLKEFNRSLSDENVEILDPFTGTGTFIVRLLQSQLIKPQDLPRKYHRELHANEIVLLAYYIAAVNIENTYHDCCPEAPYEPFKGIVLTDTFQLSEKDEVNKLYSDTLQENSERALRQINARIKVIIGNPPYSLGQKSTNDNNPNLKYPKLEKRIQETYVKNSSAGTNRSLYDSYMKAFRWSTDRLDKTGGIICFVSNGAWLDGISTAGFRKSIEKEFTSIYVFNLRGNQRTSGEISKKEGGKIFGSGSRTPIAITLLVKNPKVQTDKATIYYYDIGDYLSREEKLNKIKKFQSFARMDLQILHPNEHGDWISLRNSEFETFIPLEPEKKFDANAKAFFVTNTLGVTTGRDAWVLNFSKEKLSQNMQRMIEFYNEQCKAFALAKKNNPNLTVENFIDTNPQKISWTANLKSNCSSGKQHDFCFNHIVLGMYRPFTKQFLYYDQKIIERPGLWSQLFPTPDSKNLVICVQQDAGILMSPFITNHIADMELVHHAQCFPLYYYEETNALQGDIFGSHTESSYVCKEGISDFILGQAKERYGKNVRKEDIFYYVYGFLHSQEYREKFANDLKKMLPRLPLVERVEDFWAFSRAGRKLADLHLNYEQVPPHPQVIVHGDDGKSYKVSKMRFLSKDRKDVILYNHQIRVENIPLEAYEYVVNGKPAIQWIMERYQVTQHKESGIINDPNDWAKEIGNPRYILDLLLSVIHVSTQTMEIVKGLPKLNYTEENK